MEGIESIGEILDEVVPVIVDKQLNIFGVGSMSTTEIQEYIRNLFNNPSLPIKVEWINDESCNAIFEEDDHVALILSVGDIVASSDSERCLVVPPTIEGEDPTNLIVRRATDADIKDPKRSWKESKYYKKKLEEKGINPETLKPISKVILKPRDGAQVATSKVSLIPRKLVNDAKSIIYGENAFSKRKNKRSTNGQASMMDVDEEELARRAQRAQRFSAHI
jgi:hypothetical protein